jgi:TPR repeat protein
MNHTIGRSRGFPLRRPVLRRLYACLALALPAMSALDAGAMPAAAITTAGHATWLLSQAPGTPSITQRAPLAVFSDPTTPCALSSTNASWAVSPLAKPAQLLAVCAAEAATGRLNARALYAQMILFGVATRPSTDRGLALLEDAALDGSGVAGRVLGSLYRQGLRVPQDYAAARRWLALAADAGDGFAADTLGLMNYSGEGAPVDNAAAYVLFARAAEHGDPHGAANAGRLMMNGQGVPIDAAGAVVWFTRRTSRRAAPG